MKASVPFKNRYLLSTLLVSAVVAVLIHFPEVLSLSDSFEREQLFTGMEPKDVFNEILFTFISLLLLFGFNALIFHFNSPLVRVTGWKTVLSFLLTWAASNLLGQLFVWLHHQFDIPAIDAMVHHYLHPLRDFIMSSIVSGSNYIFHLIVRQQRIVVENEELRTESLRHQFESLKEQLNPHMLFNSLNTLQSLIRESPARALDYTQELSRVLRYTLQDNHHHHPHRGPDAARREPHPAQAAGSGRPRHRARQSGQALSAALAEGDRDYGRPGALLRKASPATTRQEP